MYIFLSALTALVAILLILVVLVQNSKGGGLSAGFSSTNQIMGVRKTTDILEKLTWGLVGTMVVLSIISARYAPRHEDVRSSSSIEELVQQTETPVSPDQLPFSDNNTEAAPAANDSVAQ